MEAAILLRSGDSSGVLVSWFICDNGMTVAEGTARYDVPSARLVWEDTRPPAEFEGEVRAAIERRVNISR